MLEVLRKKGVVGMGGGGFSGKVEEQFKYYHNNLKQNPFDVDKLT